MAKKKKESETQIIPGIVWDGERWRLFTSFEHVTKGKRKGLIKIPFISSPVYTQDIRIKRYPKTILKPVKIKHPKNVAKHTVVYDPTKKAKEKAIA